MTRKIIAAFAISLIMASCKKESGNTGVIKNENTEVTVTNNNGIADSTASKETYAKDANGDETQEHTYRYVAEDGSSAQVRFTNSTKDRNYISITSNKKTIKVKQKEAWAKGAIYEENGVEVISEGDKITIKQGDNVIELKKARGQ